MKEANWDEIFDGKSKVKIVFEQKDVEEVLELVGNKISDKNIVTDEKGSPKFRMMNPKLIETSLVNCPLKY